MCFVWELQLQLRDSSGAAIVVWAQSRNVLTHGDLLKLMCVSRSVSKALAKEEARAFAEFEAKNKWEYGLSRKDYMWDWWKEGLEPSETGDIFPHQHPATMVDRERRICWGDFIQARKKVAEEAKVDKKAIYQGHTVKVTLKKTSGEIWIETDAVPVMCTMSQIIFQIARVDRRDSVVPYLIMTKRYNHIGSR